MPDVPGAPLDASDEALVRLLSERNPDGLAQLLRQQGPRVLGQLRREFRNLDAADLDEALSLAAHRAWQRFVTFDSSRGTLRGWFYVIARRCTLEIWRQKKRAGTWLPLVEAEAVSSESREPEPETSAFVQALHACIARLPRLQRAVIEADLRSEDVAEAAPLAAELGTTKNAVYVSRSVARKALRGCLVTQGFRPEGDTDDR